VRKEDRNEPNTWYNTDEGKVNGTSYGSQHRGATLVHLWALGGTPVEEKTIAKNDLSSMEKPRQRESELILGCSGRMIRPRCLFPKDLRRAGGPGCGSRAVSGPGGVTLSKGKNYFCLLPKGGAKAVLREGISGWDERKNVAVPECLAELNWRVRPGPERAGYLPEGRCWPKREPFIR